MMQLIRQRLPCLLLVALLCLCLLSACGQGGENGETEPPDTAPHGADFYASESDLSPYVRLGDYTGLTVIAKEGETRQDAIWRAVGEQAEVLAVPEGEIDYYYRSLTAQYRYYASLKDLSYEEILSSLGLSEDRLREEAITLATEDLIYYAVLRDSGVTLSPEETDETGALYASYVEMFSSAPYSYSEEYVRTQMKKQILETMLHDKLSDFLLQHNTVSEG